MNVMKLKRLRQLPVLLIMIVVLAAACTSGSTTGEAGEDAAPVEENNGVVDEESTGAGESSPEASGLPAALREQCTTIQEAISGWYGQAVPVQMGKVTVPGEGGTQPGCQFVLMGNGEVFSDFPTVAREVSVLLQEQGWVEDQAFLADGPTGTATGFRMGDMLALLSVGWEPTADADCPDDQPIVECDFTPAQQLYTIALDVVSTSTVQ
jgi:hypothetical protein